MTSQINIPENIFSQLRASVEQNLSESGSVFLVADPSGRVLYSYTNDQELASFLGKGNSLTEDTLGKNAVSETMKRETFSLVCAAEHTGLKIKEFFSVAAPFRDENGNPAGILALFGKDEVSLPVAGYAVIQGVKWIESQFQLTGMLKKLETESKFEAAIINSIRDSFLVITPDGTIIQANDHAVVTLGYKNKEDLIGKKVTDTADSKLAVLDVFKTGEPIYNKERFVKLRKGTTLHLMMTAIPVLGEDGKVIAVVDNVKDIKEYRSMVNEAVGSNASFTFDNIIYRSRRMEETVNQARLAAEGPLSVLLQGESGIGKELFAQAIHNASRRSVGPFVIVDCASIPRDLVESELFGYAEGAFTGARKGGRLGKFELANGGTIFLDEIGELPLEIQAKFLRALQSRSFTRIGGTHEIPVDIRVIAATNRNLEFEVKNKNFREDLFYRLSVLTIEVPPLRDRAEEDVPILAEHFIRSFEEKMEKTNIKISREAMELLKKYSWPGNVRELENVIGRAVNFCTGIIYPEHLPDKIRDRACMSRQREPEHVSQADEEKALLAQALSANGGNRKKTAESLKISRSTLYRKLDYFGLK